MAGPHPIALPYWAKAIEANTETSVLGSLSKWVHSLGSYRQPVGSLIFLAGPLKCWLTSVHTGTACTACLLLFQSLPASQ